MRPVLRRTDKDLAIERRGSYDDTIHPTLVCSFDGVWQGSRLFMEVGRAVWMRRGKASLEICDPELSRGRIGARNSSTKPPLARSSFKESLADLIFSSPFTRHPSGLQDTVTPMSTPTAMHNRSKSRRFVFPPSTVFALRLTILILSVRARTRQTPLVALRSKVPGLRPRDICFGPYAGDAQDYGFDINLF